MNDTVLVAGTQRKLQEMLQKIVTETEMKALNIKCRNTESNVVIEKKSPRCELERGNAKNQEVQKFKYVKTVFKVNGKCDIIIGGAFR